MTFRKLSVAGGILLLLSGIIATTVITSEEESQAPAQPPVERLKVPVIEADPGEVSHSIRFTGRVVPVEQFDIFAEVTAQMLRGERPFKTGMFFNKGDTLIHLDDEEQQQILQSARYNFSAQLSRMLPDINLDYPDAYPEWETYLDNFDATEPIVPLPEVESRQLKLFLNNQNIYSQYSSIRQQEIQFASFVITAPFSGVVTQSLVDPGALIMPNQRLGEFTKMNPLEIEASIPASESDFISSGDVVNLQLRNPSRTVQAVVTRKNGSIDAQSQSVKVFVKIRDRLLRPGAYVEGTVSGKPFEDAVMIHEDALIRSDQVFVMRDSTAHLRTISLLYQRGDSAVISGINRGEIIIDDFRSPAFEGTKVAPLN